MLCAPAPALPQAIFFGQNAVTTPTKALLSTCHGNGTTTVSGLNCVGATLIIMGSSCNGTCTVSADSSGNTYAALANDGVAAIAGSTFYKFAPTTTSSMSFTCGGTSGVCVVAGFTGTWTGGTTDGAQAIGGVGSNTSLAPSTSITPASTGRIIPCLLGMSAVTSAAMSSDPNFTIADGIYGVISTHVGHQLFYSIQTAAATVQPTLSWTGSSNAIVACRALF